MLTISNSVILSLCFYISPCNITYSVFIDYQVDCLLSKEYVPEGVSPIVLTTKAKWLNIILDINGILCHCMEKAGMSKMPFVYDVKHEIHLSKVPTIVGPKAAYTRPGLLKFLIEISKFAARIFIWSSIKRFTVHKIVEYLFAVCHYHLTSLDRTVAERSRPLGASTSLSLVGRRRSF